MNKVITDILTDIIESYNDENTIVFLKGFGIEYYVDLARNYPVLHSSICPDSVFNLLQLTESKRALIRSVMNNSRFAIGLYEELLLLGENIKDLTDARILVIENNYYDGLYPAEYDTESKQTLEKIMSSIENESLDHDPDGKLADIVSQIQLIDGCLYISYFDLKQSVESQIIKLFDIPDFALEIGDFSDEIVLADYRVEDPLELTRLKREIELDRVLPGDLSLKVEPSLRTNKRVLSSLYCITLAYPGISLKLVCEDRLKPVDVRQEFNDILQEYWQVDQFREIDFYENPDLSTNKIRISQAVIIQSVVGQVEKAQAGQKYQDVFVTAPTGAGKSMLFQIPAIYLAQKHQFVTIVISPLKALMFDQVRQLKEKGIDFVEYINSDLTQVEKQDILASIQSGQTSIIYVSPELLLAYDIRSLVGETRTIGLIVIDEAHLVTTWGRDFRIDYWYLGAYIRKLRNVKNKGMTDSFVVASFTATAVYGGNDDMVFETIASLNLLNPIKFLGNTRRDNIKFKISNWEKRQSYEVERQKITIERIKYFVDRQKKSLVYAPYRRHINEIAAVLEPKYAAQVVKYHAGLDKDYKEVFEEKFREGRATVMLATKAFGMGIDISDIEIVYHHAPTGNLCDYIQEIGRVGRNPASIGYAVQDFNAKHDLHYAKILYGLSGMKQYQLREVLNKLYKIYSQEGRRNFLVNAESFRHIFSSDDDYEAKLKSALLLLEKDLEAKYAYPIIIVRPKSLFSKAYAVISNDVLDDFLGSPYADYVKLLAHAEANLNISGTNKDYIVVKDIGPIYEIDLKRLWEDRFAQLSFPQVKRHFYEKQLFEGIFKEKVIPRYRLTLRFLSNNPDSIMREFNKHIQNIIDFYSGPVRSNFFTKETMRQYLKNLGYGEVERRKIANAMIDLFTIKQGEENKAAFIQKRSVDKEGRGFDEQEEFRVVNLNYLRTFNDLIKQLAGVLQQVDRNGESKRYLAVKRNDTNMLLSFTLEAFSMASYDVRGGESPEIFIRINDPYRISTLVANNLAYSNSILKDIKERQERSFKILRYFFTSLPDDETRWDYVEDYFLGRTMEEQV